MYYRGHPPSTGRRRSRNVQATRIGTANSELSTSKFVTTSRTLQDRSRLVRIPGSDLPVASVRPALQDAMIANNPPAKRQPSIMTTHSKNQRQSISRRAILKDIALAPLLLRSAPLRGLSLLGGTRRFAGDRSPGFPFPDVRLTPHYPSPSPLADILHLVAARVGRLRHREICCRDRSDPQAMGRRSANLRRQSCPRWPSSSTLPFKLAHWFR